MSQRVAKTRRELMREFVPASPLVRHLGIDLAALRPSNHLAGTCARTDTIARLRELSRISD